MAVRDTNYHAVIVYSGEGSSPEVRAQIAQLTDNGLREGSALPYGGANLWVTLEGATADQRVIPLPDYEAIVHRSGDQAIAQAIITSLEHLIEDESTAKTEQDAEHDASWASVNTTRFATDEVYRNAWTAKVQEIGGA